MPVALALQDWASIAQLVTACVAVYLGFLAARATARPKIAVAMTLARREVENEHELTFECRNVGQWYAKPAATSVRAYVNVVAPAVPLRLRFGAAGERESTQVRVGKGGAQYLKAEGVHLTYWEPPESLVVTVQTRRGEGFSGWITLIGDQGDLCTERFEFPH